MGWTADCIESYGVVVKDGPEFAARMAEVSKAASRYVRKVERKVFCGEKEPRIRVRKRRFGPLKKTGEVFVFAYVTESICDEGRGLCVPSCYCTPTYSHAYGERNFRMNEDEQYLHQLVLKHFPEGRLATFTTVASTENLYAW